MDVSSDPVELSENQRHRLLSSATRRRAVEVLDDREAPVSLDALADAIASHDDRGPAPAPTEHGVRVELHHCHLPKLARAGLLEYEPEDRLVRSSSLDALA